MCEGEQIEVPQGVHYLTLNPERPLSARHQQTLEDLEQRRLNETIEIEYYVDALIQKVMKERS